MENDTLSGNLSQGRAVLSFQSSYLENQEKSSSLCYYPHGLTLVQVDSKAGFLPKSIFIYKEF